MKKKKENRQTNSTKTSSKKSIMGRPKGSGSGHKLMVLEKTYKRINGKGEPKIIIHPEKSEDIEKILPEPMDEASGLKYPPPKKHTTFRKIWAQSIDNVTSRENFNLSHLNTLEILCDLYVEYESLQEYIRVHGRSYLSVGRSGEVWKFYPEVNQLSRVQSQIREYSKMLDLVLKKDHGTESGSEKSEWE